jgi:hypothetical protein
MKAVLILALAVLLVDAMPPAYKQNESQKLDAVALQVNNHMFYFLQEFRNFLKL